MFLPSHFPTDRKNSVQLNIIVSTFFLPRSQRNEICKKANDIGRACYISISCNIMFFLLNFISSLLPLSPLIAKEGALLLGSYFLSFRGLADELSPFSASQATKAFFSQIARKISGIGSFFTPLEGLGGRRTPLGFSYEVVYTLRYMLIAP